MIDQVVRNLRYEDDGSEDLISRSSWPLRLSGVVFAGLLIVGRSATYGNLTWTPSYHSAPSPLVVVATQQRTQGQPPAVPKPLPGLDPAAFSKRSAAAEVVVFSPGHTSGEGEGEGEGNSNANANHDHDAQASGHGSAAGTVGQPSQTSAAAQGSGHGSGAGTAGQLSQTSAAAQGSGHGSGAGTVGQLSQTSAAAQGSGHGSGAGTVGQLSQTSAAAQGSGHGSGAGTAGQVSQTSAVQGSNGTVEQGGQSAESTVVGSTGSAEHAAVSAESTLQATGASAAVTAVETTGSVQASGASLNAGATVNETSGSVGTALPITSGQGVTPIGQGVLPLISQTTTSGQAVSGGAGVSGATAVRGGAGAAAQGVGTLANTGGASQEQSLAMVLGLVLAFLGIVASRPRQLVRRLFR
jgi:hypothetical protein